MTTSPSSSPTPQPPHVAAVEIWTRDLQASLAFYQTLGIDVPDVESGAAFAVTTFANGLAMVWATDPMIRSYDPTRQPGNGDTTLNFEIAVASPEDVDDTYKRLLDTGHHGHLPPFVGAWGARFATIHDPDGNPIGLNSPLT